MIVVQGKERLKTKVSLYSMIFIQKRFKTIIDRVLRITVVLENIH